MSHQSKLYFCSLEGWRYVSKISESPLAITVLNGVEAQSESLVAPMFSSPLRILLKKHGLKEAHFCKLVQSFMEGNDMPGTSSVDKTGSGLIEEAILYCE